MRESGLHTILRRLCAACSQMLDNQIAYYPKSLVQPVEPSTWLAIGILVLLSTI